jgi:arylsulfatase A-like enzyme
MKRGFLLILTVLVLLMIPFVTLSYAAIGDYDLSIPKDGDIDGKDLADLIASPSPDVAGFAGAFGQTYTVTTRPPNILLIVADDVGLDVTTDMYPGLIDSLAAIYGNGVRGRPASLPVLTDRLAAQGMVFANTWAQPYCSPTRAAIMTGLFADKTRVTTYDSPMKVYHTTFVQLLQAAGYSTAIFGKWHLAGASATCPKTGGYSGLAGSATGVTPKQAGFDLFKGHLQAAIGSFWNYPYHVQDGATAVDNCRTDTTPTKSLDGIAETKFEPVVRVADAIEWIQAREPDTPWFAYLPFNESHTTNSSPAMHTPNADTMDADSLAEVTSCGATPGGTSNGTCTAKQLNRAMTNAMDTVIGKLLNVVETLGSDTYVIFIGDNGTPMYGFGTPVLNMIDNMYITTTGRGKGTVYESGARVAMAVKGPGITAGGRSNEFVHVTDLFATILSLAGLTPPTTNKDNNNNDVPSDSVSLTPILFDYASAVRDPNEGYILTETSQGGNKVGARNATYKVMCSTNTSNANCTFYNLTSDPLEENGSLTKPSSCADYRSTYATSQPEWHYCRLIEVMNNYSIFP